MEWIKKNWKWLVVAIIVIIVVLYFVNKNRAKAGKEKISLIPGATARRVKKKEEEKQAKIQGTESTLAKCEDSAKSVRLKAGTPHPCTNLRAELSALKGESKFTGPWTKTNGLNVMDYAMGLEGMSLLEDKKL
jgi:hypothetical protein